MAVRREKFEKEWHLDLSKAQYEEMKAKGLDAESLCNPGKHTFRRRDPNKIINRDNQTVVPHLDEKTNNYYQRRTSEGEAESIEEQIKIEPRTIVEKEAA